MHAAKIVVGDVQAHRRLMVFKLFAEAVCQSSEASAGHAHGQILPLDVAGRNLSGHAAYYIAAYCYYLRRRIAYSGSGPQVGYGIGLYDLTVRNAIAKRHADRGGVRPKTVSRNFGRT